MLSDNNIFLRAPEPSDIPIMYSWENDAAVWSFGNQSAPFSEKNIEDFVINYQADIFAARQMRFIVCTCHNGLPVGTVDLYDFDPVNKRAAVGILIDTSHRRKGYALGALRILERYARARIDLHQIWAVVAKDNHPCRSLFEAADYSISGCLKSWIRINDSYSDAYIFQKLLVGLPSVNRVD